MVRSRVFSCSDIDGPGTVKSHKVEAHGAFAKKPIGFYCTATSAMLLRATQAEGYELYGGYEGYEGQT